MIHTVTGATGFIGNNLVRVLREKGKNVRSVIKTGRKHIKEIKNLETEIKYANLNNKDELREALRGSSIVYHLAAFVSIMPSDIKKLTEVNVEGTKNVVDLCIELNIPKLVYVSSVHAIAADIPHGTKMDENTSIDVGRALGAYGKTKAMALDYVLDAANNKNIDVSIVHPAGVFGHHDYRPSNFGQMLIWMYHGLSIGVNGHYNFVDVDDVVDGIIKAGERGKKGERYILSNKVYHPKAFKKAIDKEMKRKNFYISMPFGLTYFFAFFAEIFYRIIPITPVFTREALQILRTNADFSNEKAKKELGVEFTDIDKTIEKFVNWKKSGSK